MHDTEPLKPSNTGWLIADLVADTRFGWARTEVDPALLALLADPQWQPYVVFPWRYAPPERVLQTLPGAAGAGPRPLFVLLDATWLEARKMFRKSPIWACRCSAWRAMSALPAAPLAARRTFITAEVAALCLDKAGDAQAGAAAGLA